MYISTFHSPAKQGRGLPSLIDKMNCLRRAYPPNGPDVVHMGVKQQIQKICWIYLPPYTGHIGYSIPYVSY
jgi:hypothetical protein